MVCTRRHCRTVWHHSLGKVTRMDLAHEMIEGAKLDAKIWGTCVRPQFVTTKRIFHLE